MGCCECFCAHVCPNAFVLILASLLGYSALFVVFPKLFSQTTNPVFLAIIYIILIVSFAMFVWCWVSAATMDPGRVRDDLERRGLLSRCKRGDIPFCLRDLPICYICNLPKPPGSQHCEDCGQCCLRYDHHCGVIGNCVGDKNLKAFILSFLYACIFGVISSISGIYCSSMGSSALKQNSTASVSSVLILIASIYSGVISLALGGFGFGFLCQMGKDVKGKVDLNLRKLLLVFGEKWWQRLIPLQSTSTFIAWPGVFWNVEYEP